MCADKLKTVLPDGTEVDTALLDVKVEPQPKGVFRVTVRLQALVSRKVFLRAENGVPASDIQNAIKRLCAGASGSVPEAP